MSPKRRIRRDALETKITELPDTRVPLGDDAYCERLEPLLVRIARRFQRAWSEGVVTFLGASRPMGLSTFFREAGPGRAGAFDTTHWSLVLAAGQGEPEKAREALQRLCEAYWYPLYVFARRQGHDAAESEDLTQDFFASLLRRNDLTQVSPERGRFRSFLLASFKHLLINEHHRRKTVKRGGRTAFVALDAEEAEQRYRFEPADPSTPESLFERRWALTVLERALGRIRAEYARSERADLFEALKEFLSDPKALAHSLIASRHGISISAVGVAIHRLRRRYAEIIREEISHTVSQPGDIDDEIRQLIVAAGK